MKTNTKFGLVLAAAAVLSVSVASLVSAKGWVQNGSDWYYVDANGEYITDTIQSSGTAKFYLGENGAMQKDYFLEDKDNATYYFGANGAMVTNTWVAIESSRVDNQGDYVPDNYWYYFQASGKAMKGSSGNMKKTTIDGKKYGFNEYGQMCTGWIDDQGKVINPDDNNNPFENALYYGGGDNDGVLRAGWVTYYDGYADDDGWKGDKTNLYFYFNTSNNKKQGRGTKKINGKTYAFDSEGFMLTAWDVTDYHSNDILTGKTTYFSGEDDGHQVKKGWVYAVPSALVDTKAYGDSEEKYMYFGSSGDITKDQFKKINGKNYVFNRTGIMKTGLVVWCPSGTTAGASTTGVTYKYVDTLDLDWAEGSEYSKKGVLRTDDGTGDYMKVLPNGLVTFAGSSKVNVGVDTVKVHYFGEDGARKTGTNNVQFSDDVYVINTSASGNKESGMSSKKYYSMGILLKANSDIRFGIYNSASPSASGQAGKIYGPQCGTKGAALNATEYADNCQTNHCYTVLTTAGSKQKGNKASKKDADGNYWLLEKTDGYLMGIWSVNVKYNENATFETKTYNKDDMKTLLKISTDPVKDTEYNIASLSVAIGSTTVFSKTANTKLAGNDITFTVAEKTKGSEYYLKSSKFTTYWFQADYGDKSNYWIPFGWYDNAGQTCTTLVSEVLTNKDHAYEITPNDDYFLNCYWTE